MVCCCNTIGNIFRAVIVGGCAFALLMQLLLIYSCHFFSTDLDNTGVNTTIGIWYETYGGGNETCNLDSHYEAEEEGLVAGARSALVLSVLCGMTATLLVVFEWFFCEICMAGCVEGLAFVGAWGCGLGVYMIYGIEQCGRLSDDINLGDDYIASAGADLIPESVEDIPTAKDCQWGQGATYNLLACIAYFGCGILLCFAPQPKPMFR